MTNLFEAAEQAEREQKQQLELIVHQEVGLLDWNFKDLNEQLDAQLEKYKGLQFTASQMTEAKKTRADLNRVAKAINDRKIEIKKQFCEPYEIFAAQAKELVDKIKDVSGAIDSQVKEYETRTKEEKRNRIQDWWTMYGIPSIKVELVWDEKYLNATVTEAQWTADLNRKKETIKNDMAAIAQMGPEKVDWCLTEYIKTADLGRTLKAWEEHLEDIRRLEEYKARQEARKQAKMAEEQKREEEPAPAEIQPVSAQNEPRTAEKTVWWTYSLQLEGTTDQMKAFAQFIKESGIRMTVTSRKKEER